MGLTQKLGTIPLAIQTDSSNNVGIGATPTNFGSSYTVLDVYNGTVGGYLLARSPNVTGQISVDNNTAMYVQSRTNHPIVFAPNNSEKMRITTAGNVGIGNSNPSAFDSEANQLVVGTGSGNNGITIYGGSTAKSKIHFADGTSGSASYVGSIDYLHSVDAMLFTTNGGQERMRITSGGYTKISNTGSYEYVNASIHEVRNSAADYILYGTNPHASNPSGYYISYPSASPNNTSNYFIACADSSAARFRVASNGNCYNVTGTYTSGVSDIRYKEQIVDANSQWNDIKSLRVVNFKFIKDVEENGENALRQIGFIAQEVEEVSPNLVDEMYDEKTGESWKTIKASIIHLKAVKALQEAMARIEELEAKVTALENK